jgi:hypothetical protein
MTRTLWDGGLSLPNRIARNLNELNRPRNVTLVRPNPVSDDAGTQHIGDELIALAVPHE